MNSCVNYPNNCSKMGINTYAQLVIEVHSLALTNGKIMPYYVMGRFDEGELR